MVSRSSWLPCTALFLLLLLLPPSLLRAGSLQQGPGWRIFHPLGKGSRNFYHRHGPGAWQRWQQRKAKNECQGVFDLYFILDKSSSVQLDWIHIYFLVEHLVHKFRNPNMRMSFVLYSGDGQTLMPLTGDRKKIREGLRKLMKVVPKGHKYMQEGFRAVNEQIAKVNSGGKNVASMIIALTDGVLDEITFKETKEQADKARRLGAIVYTVGVLDYNNYQMLSIADSPNHMFGVDTGFKGLKGIAEPLAFKACLEITSVETSTLCTGEPYETIIIGRGFENAKSKDQVICRFKFSESVHIDNNPTSMSKTSIICPGAIITQPDQEVFIKVSLNNGVSFIGNQFSIASTNCIGRLHDFGVPVSTTVSSPVSSTESSTVSSTSSTTVSSTSSTTVSSTSSSTASTVNSIVMTINGDVRLAVRSPVTSSFRVISDVQFDPRFLALLPLLLLIPLLVYCIWRLCCKPPEPPPPPEKEPEPPPPPILPPINTCPTVIVSCCGCRPRVLEGRTNPCCRYIPPRCAQMPLTWYHPGFQRRCGNFAFMSPPCGQIPCSPSIVLQPSRECFRFAQPPCSPRICLAPSRECFPIPQELCTSGVCLQPARECLSMPQTVCAPRICLKPSRGCLSLSNYPQCQHLPPKCSQPPFSMLPLLSPSARKSIESLDPSCHPCPTSKRPKT